MGLKGNASLKRPDVSGQIPLLCACPAYMKVGGGGGAKGGANAAGSGAAKGGAAGGGAGGAGSAGGAASGQGEIGPGEIQAQIEAKAEVMASLSANFELLA